MESIGYYFKIFRLDDFQSIFHWLFSDLVSFAGTQVVGSPISLNLGL